MPETTEFKVQIEGFILGTWQKKGATVRLTAKQAKPFLREGRLAEVEPKEKPAKAPGKSRA